MTDHRIDYRQNLIERDRLDMLHEIAIQASVGAWADVEKYKDLYEELYGPLPGKVENQEVEA